MHKQTDLEHFYIMQSWKSEKISNLINLHVECIFKLRESQSQQRMLSETNELFERQNKYTREK